MAFCLTLTFACKRDDYYEGNDVVVELSIDTLRIDTVFTSVGSSTRIAKLYNPKPQPILVDISLKGISNKVYSFNADGVKGPDIKQLEIGANDSIYVFVEATIDPDQPVSISPFIIEDQLVITANGNITILYLEAWGQNANYIPASKKPGGTPYLSCDLGIETWDDPRPYVIYGILVIDSCTLVLPAGAKLYVHGGVVRNAESIYNDGLIVVQKYGKILSNGTVDNPVVIQGDRLEPDYANEKSQWVGLLFWQQSVGNKLTHTQIKNSIIGVRADSLASLTLNNCIISNTGSSGIIGRHATINANNTLVFANGSFSVALTYGGNYNFNYCTIANYEGSDESLILTDFQCKDVLCTGGPKLNKIDVKFKNCIIGGAGQDEIFINHRGPDENLNYSFTNSAFLINELLEPKNTPDFLNNTSNCITLKNNDKVFNNISKNDYTLDTMSVLFGKATPIANITIDLIEKTRKASPDLGCYEF
jgi:hypothetical protein